MDTATADGDGDPDGDPDGDRLLVAFDARVVDDTVVADESVVADNSVVGAGNVVAGRSVVVALIEPGVVVADGAVAVGPLDVDDTEVLAPLDTWGPVIEGSVALCPEALGVQPERVATPTPPANSAITLRLCERARRTLLLLGRADILNRCRVET